MSMFDESGQTEQAATKEPMPEEKAVEFALLFGFLAASGVKDDKEKYRTTLYEVFTEMLNGLGYIVVRKEI